MRIIAVINQKGGCGKTTTAINLAASLAEVGRRVLLVDMDPQGHASLGLSIRADEMRRTMHNVLLGAWTPGGAEMSEVILTISTNLHLAPSTITLSAVEQQLAGVDEREHRLRDALASVAGRYDYCVIDSPPGVGLLTFNALRAADEILVPVETGFFSMHGLAKMLETVELLNAEYNQDVPVRILATMYDYRHRIDREVLTEIRRRCGRQVLQTVVRLNVRLREAASFGLPITEFDANSLGARDYLALAMEYIQTEDLEVPLVQADALDTTEPETADSLVLDASAMPDPADRAAALVSLLDAAALQTEPEAFTPETARVAAAAPETLADEPVPLQWSIIRPEEAVEPEPEDEGERVVLTIRAPQAGSVQVAGDFNNWTPEALERADLADGVWRRAVVLDKGQYQYRFVIDNQWCQDPGNPHVADCPYGGYNSVLTVA